MPDTGFLCLSLLSVVLGALLILKPSTLSKLSSRLNRTITVLDDGLIRHRHVTGLLAFVASYAFFQLALMLPHAR